MRLFVGVYPDEELKAYFRDVISELQKFSQYLKFTPVEQIHLTVKFLGNDISSEVYAQYAEEFENNISNTDSFEVVPSELSFGFKYQIRPKVLIMNMEDNTDLDNLTQIATDSAKGFSYTEIITKKEHKKLLHHVTIGRPKRIPSKSEGKRIREALSQIELYDKPLLVDKVHLIESILTAQGPIYKTLRSYNLKTTN